MAEGAVPARVHGRPLVAGAPAADVALVSAFRRSQFTESIVLHKLEVAIAAVAGFFRLDEIAELANAGTLIAFIAVGACLMIMRRRAPDMPRLFRCPAPYLVGTLAILGCLYLFFSLPASTIARFVLWNALGLVFYFAYGRRHSWARITKE